MRKGIALLITTFFVMAITLSIGLGFKYVNNTKKSVTDEQFMFQTSSILEDILSILKNSKQLKDIKDSDDFIVFLSESSFIPLSYNDTDIKIELKSARGKININTFKDKDKIEIFKRYLVSKMVVSEYADMILDSLGGIKDDNSYYSDIFNNHPNLFRDYIASANHLDKLNEIYKNKYNDNNIKNLNTENLFFVNKDINTSIDLNFATTNVWELMLGCTTQRAESLNANAGSYKNIKDLNLADEEKQMLSKFKYSFYEPILDIKVSISQNNKKANIEFEYNIKTNKASNFVILN